LAKVLIIDDDPLVRETLGDLVERAGHQSLAAATMSQGRELAALGVDVAFVDVRLPDGNGLDLIPEIKAAPYSPEVIIITGFGDADGAELAIRHGAWDYVDKGSSWRDISLALNRALQYREGKQSVPSEGRLEGTGIVGSSAQIKACLGQLAKAAASDTAVLITGETGTGKEVFSRAIHQVSRRARGPFVVVDCAALPPTLIESALFGHERGAFTGAETAREGLVAMAHGGVLFLDEVGELPPQMQKSFLRVLDSRAYRPLGGQSEQKSDFRLIAATNRDLEEEVRLGRFREDLLFRLRAFHLALPPLRGRAEDIRDLTFHYLARFSGRNQGGGKGFSPEFWKVLCEYDWPGNVRELINTLERALAAAGDQPTLYPWHLPDKIRIHAARRSLKNGGGQTRPASLPTWREAKESLEKTYMHDLMAAARGNVKRAARLSGLSQPRVYELMRKHGLKNS